MGDDKPEPLDRVEEEVEEYTPASEPDPGPRPPTPPRRRKTPVELQHLRLEPEPKSQPDPETKDDDVEKAEEVQLELEETQNETKRDGDEDSKLDEGDKKQDDAKAAPVSPLTSPGGTLTPRVATPVSRLATPTVHDSLRVDDRSLTGSPIARKAVGSAPSREVREVSSASTINHFLKSPITIIPDRIGGKGDDIPKSAVIQSNIKSTKALKRGKLQKTREVDWRDLGASWVPELLWFATAAMCLIIMAAVLSSFDGRALSEMPGVHLNTFIAFFSIAMGLAMYVPVTEAMSQWKWNHFKHEQKVSDFETFDLASRGVFGAVMFLWRFKWTNLGGIGAVMMLFGMLAVPLTQLLVSYPTGLVALSRDATIRATRMFETDESAGSLGRTELLNSLSNGFLASIEDPITPIRPTCHSSNCTFPLFRSIGVCVKLADITDQLTITKSGNMTLTDAKTNKTYDSYGASLPGGSCSTISPFKYTLGSCKTDMQTSLAFAGDDDLERSTIYSMPIIYSNPNAGLKPATNTTPGWSYRAVEALFHLCVNEYDVSVENGIPTTHLTQSSYAIADDAGAMNGPINVNCSTSCNEFGAPGCGTTGGCSIDHDDDEGWLALGDPAAGNANTDDEEDGDERGGSQSVHPFTAHIHALHNLATSMFFIGTGRWGWDGSVSENLDEDSTLTAVTTGGLQFVRLANAVYGEEHDIKDPEVQLDRLNRTMQNVATSLTNTIRTLRPPTTDETHNSYPVYGTVWVHQSHVKINWGWITWLILELLAAMAFVGMTIWFTHVEGVRVLKGSALASMCALDDDARAAVGGLEADHAMSRKARYVNVKLNLAMDALELSQDCRTRRQGESEDGDEELRPETGGSGASGGSDTEPGGVVMAGDKRAEASAPPSPEGKVGDSKEIEKA